LDVALSPRNLKASHWKVCSLLLSSCSKTLIQSSNKFLYRSWRFYRLSVWIQTTALLWILTELLCGIILMHQLKENEFIFRTQTLHVWC
jgi:hypothetical protein